MLKLEQVTKAYPYYRRKSRSRESRIVVDNATIEIPQNKIVSLVGESGSGKSTLARMIMRFVEPTSGLVSFNGSDVLSADRAVQKVLRPQIQMVFQDPYSSLNPRRRICAIMSELVRLHRPGEKANERVIMREMIAAVGLQEDALDKYPHQFSGGQRQRLAIARALIVQPRLLVCDEAVSALDVSIQAQILNLLCLLQRERGISILFISHDLAVVRQISHYVYVLYKGQVVEAGEAENVFHRPRHPYTASLVASIPGFPTRGAPQPATPTDASHAHDASTGCKFYGRCRYRSDRCAVVAPELLQGADDQAQAARCHNQETIDLSEYSIDRTAFPRSAELLQLQRRFR